MESIVSDSMTGSAVILVTLLIAGFGLGQIRREQFSVKWLFVASGFVLLNDAALTNGFGMLPDSFSGSAWNWRASSLPWL